VWQLLKQSNGPAYTRIPLASRNKASLVYTSVLNNGIKKNDKPAWDKIVNFPRCGLGSSKRDGKKHTSQATLIKKRLLPLVPKLSNPLPKKTTQPKPPKPSTTTFGSRIAAKLGMGDVRGAVNIVTSKESILQPSLETKALLQVKHPPRKRSDSRVHQLQMSTVTLTISGSPKKM
jgi:hypothetical protein